MRKVNTTLTVANFACAVVEFISHENQARQRVPIEPTKPTHEIRSLLSLISFSRKSLKANDVCFRILWITSVWAETFYDSYNIVKALLTSFRVEAKAVYRRHIVLFTFLICNIIYVSLTSYCNYALSSLSNVNMLFIASRLHYYCTLQQTVSIYVERFDANSLTSLCNLPA